MIVKIYSRREQAAKCFAECKTLSVTDRVFLKRYKAFLSAAAGKVGKCRSVQPGADDKKVVCTILLSPIVCLMFRCGSLFIMFMCFIMP